MKKKEKNKREKVIEERKKKEAPIPEKSYSEGIGANITVKDKREKVFINGKAYLLDEKEIKFLKGDPPSKEYLERIKDLEKEVEMVEKSIEEIKANKSVRLDLTNALLTSEDIPQAYVFQTQKITGLKATKEDLLKGQEEFVKVYNECMLSAIEDLSESIVSGKFDETKIKENFLDKKYQVTNVKGKKVSISINEILSGKIAFNRVLLSIAKNENKDTKVLESVNNIISANNISEEMFLLNFVEKIEVAIENKEHSAEEKLTNKEQILIENRLDHVKKSINKAIGEYHNIVASDVNMCLSKDVDITNRLKKEAHNENKIYEGCRLHQMFDGLLSIKKTDADLYKNILPSVAPNIVNIFSKRESEMGEYLVESVAKVYKSKEDYLPAIFDSIQLISEISPNVRDRMVSVFLSELNYNGIMKNMDENKKEEFIAGIEKIANSNSSDKSFYNSIKENLVTKYNFKPTEQIKNERREKEARELELMKEKEAKELALKKEEDRLREERILQAKLREEKEREEARIATIKLEEKKKRDIEATRELIKNLKEAEE
jgi:hypothetical protein